MLTEPKALQLASQCDTEDAFEVACSRELRKLYIQKQDLLNALSAAVERQGFTNEELLAARELIKQTNRSI